MSESVLTSKGQVTLPKEIRERYNLDQGDIIDFVMDKKWIIMVPRKGNILDLYGTIKHKGGAIDFKQLREKIKKEFARIKRR